ncbi:MAG: hypothetical protein ACKOLA_14670 [Spartobacteria bacterium]
MSGLRSAVESTPANGAKFRKNSALSLSSRSAFNKASIPSPDFLAAKIIRSHSRSLSCCVDPFAIHRAMLSSPVCNHAGSRSILSAIKWNIFNLAACAGFGS